MSVSQNIGVTIYLREIKKYIIPCKNTNIFIAAVFITTKKWKEPKRPSTDERINKSDIYKLKY